MKKMLSRLALILFGVLLLLVAEFSLRLLWHPPPTSGDEIALVAIDPFRIDGGKAVSKEAFKGAMRFASLDLPKPPERFRIFCLGGSVTMGYPFPPESAWPNVLERRLRAIYPRQDIEVINLGGNSYGSARMLAVLRGILKYEPDMIIVAAGDTEFVEDSFRAAVAMAPAPTTWLHNLHLSRALKKILPQKKVSVARIIDADSDAAGLLFAHYPGGSVYQATPQRRLEVGESFAANLERMVEEAKVARVPLLFSTLPANLLDWPPGREQTRPPTANNPDEWSSLWNEARRLSDSKQYDAALKLYVSASRIWQGNAEFCYEFGQLLVRVGKVAEAGDWFVKARDLDPKPVRASSEIQHKLQSVALAKGVSLADPAARFDALSLAGEKGLLLDYAHPTPAGHLEMARIVSDVLVVMLPKEWTKDAGAVSVFEAAEKERAGLEQPETDVDLSYSWGVIFDQKGQFDRAAEMYLRSIEQGNSGAEVRKRLATALLQQGEMEQAYRWAIELNRDFPDYTPAYGLLGFLYERSGRLQEAVSWYQKAIVAGERDPKLLATTARLLLRGRRVPEAKQVLSLTQSAGNCQLSALYGEVLEGEKDFSAAEQHYRGLIAKDPSCHEGWESLGLLLMNQGEWESAGEVFRAALSRSNAWPFHHLNLGIVYQKGLNKPELAAQEFSAFMELRPDQSELVPPQFRSNRKGP